MAGNKTRVPVRGTIGKSVPLPSSTASAGAIIGVNLRLPNGMVPTLQQLAAALATGASLQDQPGNITPPGGAPAVVWQNIQYVPPQITYPSRYVAQDDEPEDRLIIPGPQGLRGLAGLNSMPLWPEDIEDALSIPGPAGARGLTGANATPMWPDDPDDPLTVPGPAGAAGSAGSPGAPGVNVTMWPDDAEDPGLIPGSAGPPGSPGSAGAPGAPGVNIAQWPDDAEDLLQIQGPPGNAGSPGSVGVPGTPGINTSLWPDDAEDSLHFLGPQGNVGAQGAAGSAGAAGTPGTNVTLWPDDAEDALHFLGPQGNVGATGAAGTAGGASAPPVYLVHDDPDDASPFGVTYGAPPSVGVGLTGKNGAANTYMRSDAAPALDQSITPTWVGTHVFNSGTMFPAQVTAGADLGGLLVNGAQNNVGLTLNNTQAGATANWRISSSATGSGFGAGNLAIGSGSTQYANFLGTTGELHLLNTIGSVYGGQFALINSSVGATNTAKYFRINPTGGLELINSAYSVALLSITDAGAMNAASTITGAGMVSNAQGFFASAGAATQVSALTVNQTGQAQWVLYQAASSNDLRVFGNGADRATFFSDGGFTMGSPTGGDKGAGSINAQAVYVQGVAVSTGPAGVSNSGVGWAAYLDPELPEDYHSPLNPPPNPQFQSVNIAPSSGNALSLTSVAGTYGAVFNSPSDLNLQLNSPGVFSTLGFAHAGTDAVQMYWDNTALAFNQTVIGANPIRFLTNTTLRMTIAGTGATTFSAPTSGVGVTVNGVANNYAMFVNANATVGQSFGLRVFAGTSASDFSFVVSNVGSTLNYVLVAGDGGVQFGAPTGGSLGVGTVNATGYYLNGKSFTNIDAVKAALTSRASTVVLANDPNLVIAIPVAGTYEIELIFNAWNTASAAAGVSWNLNYSGTFTAASSLAAPAGNNAGLTYVVTSSLIAAAATTSMFSNNVAVTAATATVMIVKGTLVATGTGNLGFAWAEAATNATGTNVGAGSRLSVRRIA